MRDRCFALRALGNSRECIYAVGSQQRILLWSAGATRQTGYTAAEALGRQCYQLIGGARRGTAWCRSGCSLQRSVARGVLPESVKLQIRTKAGTCLWCEISFIVLESPEGPLIVHASRDVSWAERRDAALRRIVAELGRAGFSDGVEGSPEKEVPDPGLRNPHDGALSRLTPREVEVLELLAAGLSTKAISTRLSVSIFTVRSHIEHALAKSELHSRTEAVAAAFRAGLLPLR